MLRHTGQRRNIRHDLRLAVLLSLNAGFINAAGFFAFGVLTTNVTGHAAGMAVHIANGDMRLVRIAALWLLAFLLGAFSSSFVIAKVGREKAAAYTIPILVIAVIVLLVALLGGHNLPATWHDYFTGSLLFAMGMQNALVSVISGSVVRTTHLTGMFTDLGIDVADAITKQADKGVKSRILLRTTIISSFLAGGIVGSLAYNSFSFHAFFIPAGITLTALFYDYFRVTIKRAVTKGAA